MPIHEVLGRNPDGTTYFTFTDAIGSVRFKLWLGDIFQLSRQKPGTPLSLETTQYPWFRHYAHAAESYKVEFRLQKTK